MDEENTVAENIEAVEDNSQDTSPVDETTTSESPETDETPSIEESSAETQSEPERKPSRAERRIRELSEEVKRLKQQPDLSPFQQPQAPQVEPGGELTVEQYQQHVAQQADAIASLRVQQQLQQYEATKNFESDIELLPQKYPELDETSPEYNPVLVEKVSEAFKARAFNGNQVDPSVRLADVAKDYVDVARAAAKKSSADMKNAVAASADTSAIKPTATPSENKSASDMSIEELEQKYGFAKY